MPSNSTPDKTKVLWTKAAPNHEVMWALLAEMDGKPTPHWRMFHDFYQNIELNKHMSNLAEIELWYYLHILDGLATTWDFSEDWFKARWVNVRVINEYQLVRDMIIENKGRNAWTKFIADPSLLTPKHVKKLRARLKTIREFLAGQSTAQMETNFTRHVKDHNVFYAWK